MKAVTISVRTFIPEGAVYVMPNVDHPEVDLWMTIDQAEHLTIACHPKHEQVVRDAVAIEQERPKWWRDLRRIEVAIAAHQKGTFGSSIGPPSAPNEDQAPPGPAT